MRLDLGPVVRSLRRQPAVLALVILEMAAGVTTISSLIISGAWYDHVGHRPSGLDESNLILMTIHTPSVDGDDDAAADRAEDQQRAADARRAAEVAGVQGVASVSDSILEDRWSYPILFSHRRSGETSPATEGAGWGVYADSGLARTLGLVFVSGAMPRIPAQERPSAVVLTRCLAERLFGVGGSSIAVGATISSPSLGSAVPVTGVVNDVVMRNPFMPHAECVAFLFGGQPRDHETRIIVRAPVGQRTAVMESLRERFSAGAGQRFVEIKAFDSGRGVHRRIGAGLLRMLGFFGALVGIVALLGSLAATSFLVAHRTRQIGIRRALGATRADIVSYFLVESTVAVGLGSLLGILTTWGLFTLMRQVFSDMTLHWELIALTLVMMWVTSIVATLVPALRAARVPPSVASRSL